MFNACAFFVVVDTSASAVASGFPSDSAVCIGTGLVAEETLSANLNLAVQAKSHSETATTAALSILVFNNIPAAKSRSRPGL